jgi:hypothetical protein
MSDCLFTGKISFQNHVSCARQGQNKRGHVYVGTAVSTVTARLPTKWIIEKLDETRSPTSELASDVHGLLSVGFVNDKCIGDKYRRCCAVWKKPEQVRCASSYMELTLNISELQSL